MNDADNDGIRDNGDPVNDKINLWSGWYFTYSYIYVCAHLLLHICSILEYIYISKYQRQTNISQRQLNFFLYVFL